MDKRSAGWAWRRYPGKVAGAAAIVAVAVVVTALTGLCTNGQNDDMATGSPRSDRVLSIGLHPGSVDYDRYPGITEEMLTAAIARGETAMRDAGFDILSCPVPADPAAAEAAVRGCLAGQTVGVVMIGAGVRAAAEHTLLFERLVNVVNELVPGIAFCFNTEPATSVDALRRWVRPAGR
ncbi:hypothetical protein ACWCPQ_16400 [Nocardia sp. NPDC001965]